MLERLRAAAGDAAARAVVGAGRAAGLAIRRLPRPLLKRPESQLGPELEHLVAHRMSMLDRAFFFVQIGAMDGRKSDPIHALVNRHGWNGILVEPQRSHFSILRHNYGDRAGLEFRNVAISEQPGKKTLYRIRHEAEGVPDWAPGLASFDRDTILAHRLEIPDVERLIETEEVECVTLPQLLAGAPQPIDLIVIDVEGYDAEIIRMLDLERFRPSIVHFEHKHLSRRQWEASVKKLLEHGYRVGAGISDTVAYCG
jgi:FkbM family methyltransferase